MFGFENLEVWQGAIRFCNDIYAETRADRTDERFGLTNQIRRAAVSMAANIAEGSGRRFRKDFSRFTEIAYSSLMETVSHLRVASDQQFLPEPAHVSLYSAAEELARMLSGLQTSLDR